MILPINNKYRVKSDSRSWMIQVNAGIDKKTNKIKWDSKEYYRTLEGLVNGLSERMLRESKAETLVDALNEVKMIHAVLSRALSPTYRLVPEKDIKKYGQ